MSDSNNNLEQDIDFSLDEIKSMSEDEIKAYNENSNHGLKIRKKTDFIIFDFVWFIAGFIPILSIILPCILSARTQKSQRKRLWISYVIIQAIVITIVTIIKSHI